jgi:hypothetical protein
VKELHHGIHSVIISTQRRKERKGKHGLRQPGDLHNAGEILHQAGFDIFNFIFFAFFAPLRLLRFEMLPGLSSG